jgi:sugar/nucleoside kinase (ribokinase family)
MSFRYLWLVLAAVGDLVEDVVVRPRAGDVPRSDPARRRDQTPFRINLGTDTAVSVERRQGGSAANVCVMAAGLDQASRFIGQLGDDETGRVLARVLIRSGVEVVGRRSGKTGTVIALCHADGERSMLTDRGSCCDLDYPDPAWLEGVGALHVPLYSMDGDPLARTTATLAGWARERGLPVSLDLSSAVLVQELGRQGLRGVLALLRPAVVLANEAEGAVAAELVGLDALAPVTVVKRGPAPALLHQEGQPVRAVAASGLGPVPDSTGAGDAFAAGLLTALLDGASNVEAVRAGHRAAASRLLTQGATPA